MPRRGRRGKYYNRRKVVNTRTGTRRPGPHSQRRRVEIRKVGPAITTVVRRRYVSPDFLILFLLHIHAESRVVMARERRSLFFDPEDRNIKNLARFLRLHRRRRNALYCRLSVERRQERTRYLSVARLLMAEPPRSKFLVECTLWVRLFFYSLLAKSHSRLLKKHYKLNLQRRLGRALKRSPNFKRAVGATILRRRLTKLALRSEIDPKRVDEYRRFLREFSPRRKFFWKFERFFRDFTRYRFREGFNRFRPNVHAFPRLRRFSYLRFMHYFRRCGRWHHRRVLHWRVGGYLRYKKNTWRRPLSLRAHYVPRQDRRPSIIGLKKIFPPRMVRLLALHNIHLFPKVNYNSLLKYLARRYFLYRLVMLDSEDCNFYYLRFKKKKNNYYLTVFNSIGEVIQHVSSGQFSKEAFNKRNKKLRSSLFGLQAVVGALCWELKRKRISKIRFFIKPAAFRSYMVKRLVFSFLNNGIRLMYLKTILRFGHGGQKKNKKKRRL